MAVSFEEEVKAFMERMGYKNVEVDIETNQLNADWWVPPLRGRVSWDGWQSPEEKRLVRYRRSPNGVYQEVWTENGRTTYGMYMPEGFVPPEEDEHGHE